MIIVSQKVIAKDGGEIRLSPLELRAVQSLYESPGIVTKDELAYAIYGNAVYDSGVTDEMVAKVIARLRNRLDGEAIIITHRGIGYSLEAQGGGESPLSPLELSIAREVSGLSPEAQRVILDHILSIKSLLQVREN